MEHETLKKTLLKTFEQSYKTKLIKKTTNLHFSKDNQIALCIMTSKDYPVSYTQKYWYTLTPTEKSFLESFKKSYVFLGCLDNENEAYLIPFHKYKQAFLSCDITKTGWHIRINHNLHWYFPNIPDIDLSTFKRPFISLKTDGFKLGKEEKKLMIKVGIREMWIV